MFGFFAYLRQKTREAVLGGIADAVEHADRVDWSGPVDSLRAKLEAPALPRLPADVPALPAADDDEAVPAANGAGRRKVVRG